ncbi:MAG: acyl-CoA dehydrogenase family protein [Solirubrobacteraceae bacterium]
MDFSLTDEQQRLLELARDFARREIAPRVADYDREERFPIEIVRAAAKLGLLGGVVPVEYGGAGLDFKTYAMLVEEISRVCHVIGVAMSLASGLVGSSIQAFGTEEQKQRYLAPLARGEVFGAAGVTEARSGTDVSDMDTSCRIDGGDYVINGAKMWISFLDVAEWFLTFAHLGVDERTGRKRICAFIVDASLPGVSVHPVANKFGFRPIKTGELVLEDVRVPCEALVGEEGRGFAIAMNAVENGRLGVASRATGLAQACVNVMAAYTRERVVFKQPLAGFQMVQQLLSDAATATDAARLLTLRLADLKDRGQRARAEASMAKQYASDAAMQAALAAFQVHGAYGVSEEYPVGRYLRDAKVFQIVEGNNQLHRALIAESLTGVR